MAHDSSAPDIGAILQALSSGSLPQQQQQYAQQQHHAQQQHGAQHGPRQDSQSEKPPVDPSTIIEWSPALRYITKRIHRDPKIAEGVRRLIKSQSDNERQWWNGREALIAKQAARENGRKHIEGVLKSIGGAVDPNYVGQTPEDDANELKIYDYKTHKAAYEMQRSFQAELAGLGVPFFGTKAELIMDNDDDNISSNDANGRKRLSHDELSALQVKILGLLEDLCRF